MALLLAALLAAATGAPPAPAAPVRTFPLSRVRLLDGPFREAQQRDLDYLLRLDPDRLLHTFRRNAGLPSAAAPLGGWEAPEVELRGHTLGHYLTACSLMYEATGDERLRGRALAIVAALRQVQQALPARGMHAGYLSAFPEELFDRLEARQRVWAPYYTLHKIMAGLLDVYRTFGDENALAALRGMASWVALRAGRLDEARWQAQLETEFGGMQDVLTGLYSVTREPQHLRLARLFDHRTLFDALAQGEDPLDGLHANTQIPKAIGAAHDCDETGEARYCAVATSFWERVARERSYVIGGNSEDEHFFPIARFSRHLGESTAETCNTHNMLKLTRRLFERRPVTELVDFYERGLFNHILAAQDPKSGMFSYYVPLRPGSFRTYSTPEASFWCCVGTGMENPPRYGEAVYARDEASLYVNLFVASRLEWEEKGLVLHQRTRFPDENVTRLEIGLRKPERFTLRLRHPAWAEGETEVRVNGARQATSSRPGSWLDLERTWRDGDRVELRLPMSLRLERMPDDPTVVALLYGPVVLAADLGPAPSDEGRRLGSYTPEDRAGGGPEVPVLVAAAPGDVLARVEPGPEPLTFRTKGLGRPRDVELRPFFRLSDRRYAVYLDALSEAGLLERRAAAAADAARRRAVADRTVDAVAAGEKADEEAHALVEERSDSGWLEGRRFRSARYGGSFSYLLRLPREAPAALRVTYWGGETRRHVFEVTVEGRTIATQALFDDRPGEPYEVEYPLGDEVTGGRDRARVGFRTEPGRSSGAVLDVRVVRTP